MIKLIVFDLWHTLAYKDVGYHITSEILKLFHPHLSKKKLVKTFENSIQTKMWKSEYKAFENLCKNLKIDANKEAINLLMSMRNYANSKIKLYPHTLFMLRQLKNKGYKIGLISNSSVFDIKYMRKTTSLLKLIDYPLFSFNMGKIKPDTSLFRKMLKIAKCKPQEAVMIGDKKTDDVFPSRKIGMHAILFRNYKQLKKDLASFGVLID